MNEKVHKLEGTTDDTADKDDAVLNRGAKTWLEIKNMLVIK